MLYCLKKIGFSFLLVALIVVSPQSTSFAQTDAALIARASQQSFYDLPELKTHRLIRVLVSYSETNFFLEKGRQRGFEYEMINRFGDHLNEGLKREDQKVLLAFIPVAFDQLIPMLNQGLGEIAAASLTITDDRREHVDFVDPYLQNVSEIIVAGKSAPSLNSLESLSGRTIYVADASSYRTHLLVENAALEAKGLKPIEIKSLGAQLKTEDYLELVDSGIIDYTVADSYMAELWSSALLKIKLYSNIHVNSGGEIAWAIRKDSPLLRAELNRFVKGTKKGTLLGNIFFKRHYQNTQWIKNPLDVRVDPDRERFVSYFRKYAEMYDFDWLRLVAQGFQESQLKPDARSSAGAVGIMQLLPSTAADMNLDAYDPEQNIHAAAQYMANIIKRLSHSSEMNAAVRFDFALASYNAGPARVAQWRKKAAAQGLNPNLWFGNVEYIAYRETVRYVGNVNKYYIAYRLSVDSTEETEVEMDRATEN